MTISEPVSEFIMHVQGRPQGKGRPKFSKATGRAYTPAKTTIAEREIRQAWREVGEPRMEEDKALIMKITLNVERPKSHFKKNGELSSTGLQYPHPRNKKPDLDNAVKMIMDALNGCAYRDDVLITRLIVERNWSTWPFTSVKVTVRNDDED